MSRHSAAGGGRRGGKILCPEGPKTQRGMGGRWPRDVPRGSEDAAERTRTPGEKNAMLEGTITVASLLLIGSLGVRKQLGASLKPYFAKLAWF